MDMDKTADMIFEQRFSDYLEREEHDKVESTLFALIREAYKAGWLAALETLSPSGKIVWVGK